MTRTVAVRLQAEIGQYVGGMNKAAAATLRLGESAAVTNKKSASGFDLAGKSALLMGGAVVAGIGFAVSKSLQFEKAMSAVSAATGATVGTLGDLREAAMKAGADTQYSATEAAQGITEMAKAGVSAKDIMGGGLKGALSLAAAGQLDVADAAGIASTAMTQFSLSGRDLPHVADLLAAGAGKAMGSVEDLGAALNQSGLIASAAGLSIEETTGTLSAFASAGLIGSDAGTSFKTMLQSLQAPSEKSAGIMKDLGINMYDAQGNMLGVSEMAGQLQGALGGLTEEQRNSALATIFGTDAVRAANVLYKEGASGIENWTNKVNDQGYAAEQAAKLNDNLAGDLERLGGAFDTLMIGIGSGAQGPLRFLVQGFTDLLDGISSLGAPLGALVGFIADNSEVALALAAILGVQLVGGIGAVTIALNRMVLTPVVLGLSNMLGVVLNLPSAMASASAAVGGFAAAAAPLVAIGAIVYATAKVIDFATAAGDARDDVSEMWDAVDDSRGSEQMTALNGIVEQLQSKIRGLKADIGDVKTGLMGGMFMLDNGGDIQALDEYEKALDKAEAAQDRAKASAQTLGERFHLTSDEVLALAGKYDIDLSGAVDATQGKFEEMYTAEYGTAPVDAANATTGAMQSAKAATEEAAQAQEDWLKTLQGVMAGFVEPISLYKSLQQEAAQATADGTKSSEDSWSDYVDTASVSLDTFALKLQDQITAQENWRTNLVKISQRGGAEVAKILADMGVEGAGYVQEMVDANGADFAKMRDLMIRDAQLGGSGAAAALDKQMRVMAAYADSGGKATVGAIARQLGIGVGEVARIAEQYGQQLAYGINPLLGALGKNAIALVHRGGASTYDQGSRGGYAEGGYTGPGGKHQYAGPAHKGEVIWSQEDVAAHGGPQRVEKMRRARGYASGGFASLDDVPHPPSTAPYRAPISTAGDATMGRAYGDTVDWMKEHMAPPLSAGVGWQALWAAVSHQFPWAQLTSSFRPGAITATGNRSYHSMGRAIDVSPSMEIFDWIAKNYAATELIYSPAGGRQEWHGQPHMYGEPTRGDHWDHVHWAMANGGIIGEPVLGRGLRTGASYSFGERGPETVTPGVRSREFSGGGGGMGGGSTTVVNFEGGRLTGRLEMGTDGLVTLVDGRIDGAFTSVNRSLSARGRG